MIQDGLRAELHDLGYFGCILLFEEIKPQNGLPLPGQLFDLLVNVLQEYGPNSFGLDMFFYAGIEIGQVVLAFPLFCLYAEIVDGLVADDDVEPAFCVIEGFHPGSGVEEFIESIGHDVFRIGLGMDDILHEIGQWPNHLIIDYPECILAAFPKGDHNGLFIAMERSFWFYCLHALNK